jgi:short-subunit dehydrogenase
VINNASYGVDGTVEEYSIEQAKALFDVNVWGTVAVIQAVLPHMRKQGYGHIINISSGAGVVAIPGFSVYASSKFAVEGISESLAAEVRDFNIHVTIIQPGGYKTSFSAVQGSRPLDIYARYHNVAETFQSHYADGDVNKFADALLYVVDNVTTLPLRIPLGSDVVANIRTKLTAQLDDIKKAEALSLSTSTDL